MHLQPEPAVCTQEYALSIMSIQDLLQKYHNNPVTGDIPGLFAADPDRFQSFSRKYEGLLLDFSKTSIDHEAMDDLLRAADQGGLPAAIQAIFSGAIVNAWHTLLRSSASAGDSDQNAAFATERSRMLGLADALRAGKVPGCEDDISDIVHLGVGGSALGPALVTDALGNRANDRVQIHYLASADGHALTKLLGELKPEHTAVIVASKSFTTRETLLNAGALRDWLARGGVHKPVARMMAITAARESALEFGITGELVLKIWPEIGGRYSIWSSIGLPAAIAIGNEAYSELLAGAEAMDQHFRTASPASNLPVLLALCGIWHRNVCGYAILAVMPYDYRLRLLPDWLQQLDMESNGKSTGNDGEPLDCATAPAVLGGLGTISQHSVFQALHQGSDIIPVEFIGVLQPGHDLTEHHRLQIGNMLAQGEALMRGRSATQTRSFLEESGMEPEQLENQLPHRTFPGNRPSITLLMDELTPYSLGQLLALYEHKVYVQSVIWDINAFDQWGVEYGKTLANECETALSSETAVVGQASDLLSYVRGMLNRSGH